MALTAYTTDCCDQFIEEENAVIGPPGEGSWFCAFGTGCNVDLHWSNRPRIPGIGR